MLDILLKKIGYITEKEAKDRINKAVEKAISDIDDEFASDVAKRGGLAIVSLNPEIGHVPRVKFITPGFPVEIPESRLPEMGLKLQRKKLE